MTFYHENCDSIFILINFFQVIPIESSMEGNRHNFSNFLHGGIGLISVVLASFGVLGYMKYGEHTPQIITQALPPNSVVSIIVNATLMFAVIFTYPLQVFPVTEIMEGYIFSEGKGLLVLLFVWLIFLFPL